MTALFTPVVSITSTKRRRFFWAAWWTEPPSRIPFRKPDASDGGAATFEEALATATERAGVPLTPTDALWARAWMRLLRGEEAWPSRASREPRAGAGVGRAPEAPSIWELLGVARDATLDELKAAYRRRALEAHPDHGGDAARFQQVVRAYAEAQRRIARPKRRGRA